MSSELGQNAFGTMSSPVTQGIVAVVTTGGGLAAILTDVNTILGTIAIVVSMLIPFSMRRKNISQAKYNEALTRESNIRTKLLEEKEEARKEDL